MKRIRVIGIGSLIMTDDGIGVRVAAAIRPRLQAYGISVLLGETDVQYCLDEIRPEDIPVIIDSMLPEKAPGSIEIFSLQDARKSRGKLHSQHDFSLIDALLLKDPDLQGFLIGIEAVEIGFGFELSPALEETLADICEQVFKAVVKIEEAMRHA